MTPMPLKRGSQSVEKLKFFMDSVGFIGKRIYLISSITSARSFMPFSISSSVGME